MHAVNTAEQETSGGTQQGRNTTFDGSVGGPRAASHRSREDIPRPDLNNQAIRINDMTRVMNGASMVLAAMTKEKRTRESATVNSPLTDAWEQSQRLVKPMEVCTLYIPFSK